jgi:hypothetical protein
MDPINKLRKVKRGKILYRVPYVIRRGIQTFSPLLAGSSACLFEKSYQLSAKNFQLSE